MLANPESPNVLPGGSKHTAGGKIKEAKISDALKTIRPGDFLHIHQMPCARDALLVGIGAGFGMGGLRAIMGSQ